MECFVERKEAQEVKPFLGGLLGFIRSDSQRFLYPFHREQEFHSFNSHRLRVAFFFQHN